MLESEKNSRIVILFVVWHKGDLSVYCPPVVRVQYYNSPHSLTTIYYWRQLLLQGDKENQ